MFSWERVRVWRGTSACFLPSVFGERAFSSNRVFLGENAYLESERAWRASVFGESVSFESFHVSFQCMFGESAGFLRVWSEFAVFLSACLERLPIWRECGFLASWSKFAESFTANSADNLGAERE